MKRKMNNLPALPSCPFPVALLQELNRQIRRYRVESIDQTEEGGRLLFKRLVTAFSIVLVNLIN